MYNRRRLLLGGGAFDPIMYDNGKENVPMTAQVFYMQSNNRPSASAFYSTDLVDVTGYKYLKLSALVAGSNTANLLGLWDGTTLETTLTVNYPKIDASRMTSLVTGNNITTLDISSITGLWKPIVMLYNTPSYGSSQGIARKDANSVYLYHQYYNASWNMSATIYKMWLE